MTTVDYAIDLTDVHKTYRGKIKALRGVTMRVHRGEVFGLLGPNGAGKSTLVKILMTVIRASRCQGGVLGRPVGDKEALGRVGYLPEHHRFPPYLTGAQVLDFYGALGKVPREERRRRTSEMLELVDMKDWAKTKVGRYSKGMRQRIGIAQALMNSPDLVLLDEPTDGVDPVGRRDIRNIVARMRDEGKTVLINSHLLSELEMVCDRVSILVQGQVRQQGTLDELTADQRHYAIELASDPASARETFRAALPGAVGLSEQSRLLMAPPDAPPEDGPASRAGLAARRHLREELPSGEWIEIERSTIRVGTTDPNAMSPIIDALRAHGAVIRSMGPHRPSLEDLFMAAVTTDDGHTLGPGAAEGSR